IAADGSIRSSPAHSHDVPRCACFDKHRASRSTHPLFRLDMINHYATAGTSCFKKPQPLRRSRSLVLQFFVQNVGPGIACDVDFEVIKGSEAGDFARPRETVELALAKTIP
ncbi:MAG: hypothetical protein ACXV2E_09430, partial [Halobacteriota archaeon]